MFNILIHKENANQNDTVSHLIPVRMVIIKKTNNDVCEDAGNRNPYRLLVGM
jgi:hypothetical protein